MEMKAGFVGCILLLLLPLAVVAIVILGRGCSLVNEGLDVAQKQFGPKAALIKYEWFKSASAELTAKLANIDVQKQRLQALKQDQPQTRSQWSREDREVYNQIQAELVGMISAYNSLAAEYNANMAKVNYAFANVGEMPAGSAMPRNFAPYKSEQ